MPDILPLITHTLTAAYDSAIGTPASAGVSAIFKFISNTKSQKQIKASLEKKLEKELKGLVDSNLIFQSAAFANYITYQNPSEKILAWLKESQRIPETELLDRLIADACVSLRSGGLTVGIPEEQALREFYR